MLSRVVAIFTLQGLVGMVLLMFADSSGSGHWFFTIASVMVIVGIAATFIGMIQRTREGGP